MPLLASDTEYLELRGYKHEVSVEAGLTCIVFPSWPLPSGYDRESADLLVRLQAGYPDVPPDMWWFDPTVHFADGSTIPATEVQEQHLGRTWQRWSRHLVPDQWRAGIDGLENYLALICTDLSKAVEARSA
jgi:hypothetical protein